MWSWYRYKISLSVIMAPSFLVLNTLNTFLLTEKGMKEFILSKALHNPFELYHKKQNHLSLQNLKKKWQESMYKLRKVKTAFKNKSPKISCSSIQNSVNVCSLIMIALQTFNGHWIWHIHNSYPSNMLLPALIT